MDQIPIFITHRGNQKYLKTCIKQASKFNSEVWLIGDSSNAGLTKNHINIDSGFSDISTDIEEFRSKYVHFSNQGKEFEKFCIERWIWIRNIMKHAKVNKCCAIDSDVLIFSRIDEIQAVMPGFSMSFGRWDANKLCPHFNLIQNYESLDSFCRFILHIFSNPSLLEELKGVLGGPKKRPWICDMSLFFAWSQRNTQYKIAVFEELGIRHLGLDTSISRVESFKPSRWSLRITKPWKKLSFSNDQVWAYTKNNAPIKMHFIHYHGNFKGFMEMHARGTSNQLACLLLLLRKKLITLPVKFKAFYRTHILKQRRGGLIA